MKPFQLNIPWKVTISVPQLEVSSFFYYTHVKLNEWWEIAGVGHVGYVESLWCASLLTLEALQEKLPIMTDDISDPNGVFCDVNYRTC